MATASVTVPHLAPPSVATADLTNAPRSGRTLAYALFVLGLLLAVISLIAVANYNNAIARFTAQTAQNSGLASQERDLAQNLAKNALLIANDNLNNKPYLDPHAELASSAEVFNETLQALAHGGETQLTSGETVSVEPLADANEQEFISDANSIWKPVYNVIQQSAGQTDLTTKQIGGITKAVVGNGNGLAVLMNDLALQLDRDSRREAQTLSNARTTWTAFALLGFIIILFSIFVRIRAARSFSDQLKVVVDNLGDTTRSLAEAKSSTDMIMGTVRQGLLLLDREYFISPQYSHELEPILRIKSLGERNFLDIIRTLVSERSFKTAKDYMDMLFNEEKSERTLQRINPLEEVEVNFPNATTGGYDTRFLTIEFRRIYDENEEISQVFVAVSDVTERVRLERELRESEQRKERQFGMLLDIMNIDPRGLDEFVQTAAENLRIMNDSMKAEEFAAAGVENTVSAQVRLRSRLDTVYRCVHIIKGNASMLKLDFFERKAHEAETRIEELRRKPVLGGDDFLAIVLAQSALRTELKELDELRRKLTNVRSVPTLAFAGAMRGNGNASPDNTMTNLMELAGSLSRKYGKQVAIEVDEFDLRGLPDQQRRAVRDVLIQLVRNAVVHGIESPDDRSLSGKPKHGTILIQKIGSDPSAFGFLFHDDGRGIDPRRIKARAVTAGILTASEAEAISDETALGALFQPGFSTADEVTSDAGRGIGLYAVKSTVIDELGGEIVVQSEVGRYSSFSFSVPIPSSAAVSVAR